MRAKHISFAEVMDVFAFRIVVDKIDTCYRALGAIHNLYRPIPERFKDYIAIPKANGYQSLHTTLFGPHGVPIEIQIRTIEMNNMAENGIAAHWLYKTGEGATKAQLRAQNWLKGLMELQSQSSGNSLEFIENVKTDLFPDEVYVFTPKGSIMELQHGATPVDFAYAVHSDIGNACIAAKIDKRLSPLSTVLSNGQTVEIITAPGAKPNPAWLNFAVTGKARSNIKSYLKELRHTESVELGERLLTRTLKILSNPLAKISSEQLQECCKHFNYANLDELYAAIGLGNQMAPIVASYLTGKLKDAKSKKKQSLLISGTEGMVVRFAECCRPIPGDPIVGFFDKGHGIIVHVQQCPKTKFLENEPERYIPVRWQKQIGADFKVDISVEVINKLGVLAGLTSAIADSDSNILDISVVSHDSNYSIINITLTVKDRTHLALVFRHIRGLKVVSRIMRKQII